MRTCGESQDGGRHLSHGAGTRLTANEDALQTLRSAGCRMSRRTQRPAPWSCGVRRITETPVETWLGRERRAEWSCARL
ncbi:hypothetical protein NDU88_006769 [Pleurodeles waltl]|uniref:Uncharacterized protein n=1 Tax=Pleurodeles waltl TaxID=8319 RepID=A0AAV7VSC0_PLEWA|nr:hypothetical protein NDU88_006769 [Pleurodeles waltl]